MKKHSPRWIMAVVGAACLASSVGCYPYADYYRPAASNQDAKGYSVPEESAPRPQPRYVGVDPALVVAGVAAAGLVGYAIGNHHGYHHGYYGPAYYQPAPYGYYGPRHYGPRYCY